jgi:hypothetical protein
MTVRDAILLSIPVFGEHGRNGPAAVRAALIAAGIPAHLAAEVVEFLPLALARAMLEGMGIRFADHYVRQTAQGHVVGQKLLADEPVFREGLAIAGEVSGGTDEFMAVAGLSPEYRAIQKLMSSGSQPEDLQCAPPVVLANDEDRREFDDTSGGVQPRQKKPWWQFWK